jgi:hypothetical protein
MSQPRLFESASIAEWPMAVDIASSHESTAGPTVKEIPS